MKRIRPFRSASLLLFAATALLIAVPRSLPANDSAPSAPNAPELPQAQKEVNDFLMNYYKNPEPDRIPWFLEQIDEGGAMPLPYKAISPVIGFLTEVFRSNPDRLDAWKETFLNIKGAIPRAAVCNALALTGDSAAVKLGIDCAKTFFPNAKKAIERGSAVWKPREGKMILPNGKTVFMDVCSPEELDLCWGAYFATGETAIVLPILRTAMTKEAANEIDRSAAAARWSLLAIARVDEGIRAFLKEVIKRDPEECERVFGGRLSEEEQRKFWGEVLLPPKKPDDGNGGKPSQLRSV